MAERRRSGAYALSPTGVEADERCRGHETELLVASSISSIDRNRAETRAVYVRSPNHEGTAHVLFGAR
jgi:hypothetical protein